MPDFLKPESDPEGYELFCSTDVTKVVLDTNAIIMLVEDPANRGALDVVYGPDRDWLFCVDETVLAELATKTHAPSWWKSGFHRPDGGDGDLRRADREEWKQKARLVSSALFLVLKGEPLFEGAPLFRMVRCSEKERRMVHTQRLAASSTPALTWDRQRDYSRHDNERGWWRDSWNPSPAMADHHVFLTALAFDQAGHDVILESGDNGMCDIAEYFGVRWSRELSYCVNPQRRQSDEYNRRKLEQRRRGYPNW